MVHQKRFNEGFADFKISFERWLDYISKPSGDTWFAFWVILNTMAMYGNGVYVDPNNSPYPYLEEDV